jgi:prevent-host-death family protein
MNTILMDVQEAQQRFEELIEWVAKGAEIFLTKNDVPLAKLIPASNIAPAIERVPELSKGAFVVHQDFDAPLPDELWLGDE